MKLCQFLHDLPSSESQVAAGIDALFHVHWLFHLSARFNKSRSLQFSIHFESLDKHHSHVCAVRGCRNPFEQHTVPLFSTQGNRGKDPRHKAIIPHPYGYYLSTTIAGTVGENLHFQSLVFGLTRQKFAYQGSTLVGEGKAKWPTRWGGNVMTERIKDTSPQYR